MANGKWNYRVKRYMESIPQIAVSNKVEVPETILYENAMILCNAHSPTYKPLERYTLASAEKNGKTYNITILSGANAGNVYVGVPYYGGNCHFNEYVGDTYYGINFSREQEKKDTIEKNTVVSVKEAIKIVEQNNQKAKRRADELTSEVFSRPEY